MHVCLFVCVCAVMLTVLKLKAHLYNLLC